MNGVRPEKISLRWKLAIVAVTAICAALLLTGLVMAAYDLRTYNKDRSAELTAQANVLAENLVAALTFNDSNAMSDYLRAFAANRGTIAAAIYDRSGTSVARHVRPGTPESWDPLESTCRHASLSIL